MADIIARAIAAAAQTRFSRERVIPGNVGIRMFGGRIANTKPIASGAGSGTTYEVLMTTGLHFDAVRIVMACGNTVAGDALAMSMQLGLAVVGDPSDATISAASWVNGTFGGADNIGGGSPGTLTPSPAFGRWKHVISDIIPIQSVPRTDGGKYPLLVIRDYLFQASGATANTVLLGNGTQSFDSWTNHPSGRIWRIRSKGGGFAQSNQAGMTNANSSINNGTPIVGVIYYARGRVVNVVGFGDSITEGQGTYIGEGFGFPACQQLSDNAAGVAFEWSDMGWSGATLSQIRQNMLDAFSAGLKWDIGVLPTGSPNEIAAPPITSANIAATRFKVAHMQSLLREKGIAPILWTWMPTSVAGGKNYGASDALRRALNDDFREQAKHGVIIADFDSAIAGATNGSGQVEMDPATTDDQIHPNDTGNARCVPKLKRAISELVLPPSGLLVA